MPNTLSAKKRVRQNLKRRSRNRWRLRTLRDSVKNLREQILHGSSDDADSALRETQQIVDRTAAKGVIHKNTAARIKSRLSARVREKKAG
jgi:small subunit ribosomal protein S20